MPKHFNNNLIFSTIAALGLCTSGFAQELNDAFTTNNTEKVFSVFDPISNEEIIQSYETGLMLGATHMLIVWDTWNVDDSYDFIVFSYPGEDVNDCITQYNTPGFYRVAAVFAMDLDIHQQLAENHQPLEHPDES